MKLWILEKANLKHMAYTPSKTPMPMRRKMVGLQGMSYKLNM
jgi:hypothetical protein